MAELDDICRNKHGGNDFSEAANERAHPKKAIMREQITAYMEVIAPRVTMKDLCRAFDVFPHQISGRLSELKRDGVIEGTGDRRDGCEVLKLATDQQTLF